MKQQIGRHLSFVECRDSQGLGIGGGLAQRATISESGKDVCVIAFLHFGLDYHAVAQIFVFKYDAVFAGEALDILQYLLDLFIGDIFDCLLREIRVCRYVTGKYEEVVPYC